MITGFTQSMAFGGAVLAFSFAVFYNFSSSLGNPAFNAYGEEGYKHPEDEDEELKNSLDYSGIPDGH